MTYQERTRLAEITEVLLFAFLTLNLTDPQKEIPYQLLAELHEMSHAKALAA